MSSDAFEARRKALENSFFLKANQAAVEKLRLVLDASHPRRLVGDITGIQDPELLDTLVALHVDSDTVAAFGLYPLVEIAWADGKVDDKERAAFWSAAAELGLHPGTPGHEALRHFLAETPREDARKAWSAWAAELSKKLDPVDRKKLREGLVSRARAVAEASGGFFGLGNRVSPGEQRILDRIEEVFAD